MTASLDFLIGFTCFSMVALLYIMYEFVQAFKELVAVLRESLEELQDE